MGHRDRPADDDVHGPHRRRDVTLALARHADVRLRGLRRICKGENLILGFFNLKKLREEGGWGTYFSNFFPPDVKCWVALKTSNTKQTDEVEAVREWK